MDMCDLQQKKLPTSEMIKDVPNCSHSLPATGSKEFHPSNTLAETKQIEDALKQQAAMLAVAKVDKLSFLVAAEWKDDRKLALVTRRASGHFDVIGHEENARLWLFAEEILLLLELSRAELWYGGISMSIQQGYAMLLGNETGCRDIEYAVYKHLSLLGYRILRHRTCPTQYELDIGLEQCSAKSSKKLLEVKDIICVDRMPATLMEDDPAETRTDASPQEEIVLPLPSQFPSAQIEITERSISRSSVSKESEPAEDIVLEKFPSEFVVLDEWTAADDDESAGGESASIVIDDDKEIIGVSLEAKEIADDSFQDRTALQQKPESALRAVDEVAKPPSPKHLAEICPEIRVEPAAGTPGSSSDKVASILSVHSPEIVQTDETENDKSEINKSLDEDCIFYDLNAFLAEICPSPKRQEDISPMSSHTESDFISVSGIDASETVLNSLAEVSAYDVVEDTGNADDDDYSDDDDYPKLTPGFNVVVRQNMCPVLVDIPEPVERSTPRKDDAEIQIHGKRLAETTEEVGPNKRLCSGNEQESVAKDLCAVSGQSVPELGIAGNSKEQLVNGEVADLESDSESASTPSVAQESTQDMCVDVSTSESSSEDEDCLNIESNREELESPVMVEEEDSDLEIIETRGVEDLSITISNKRKQTDDDVRCVKRRPMIEVINLSDEETESEESDVETEDLNQAEEGTPDETDVMSVGSSSNSIEETQPSRQKFWTPALLEDEDRTKILKSIVNVANKTQVDLKVDWRYIPSNCDPAEKRVKVFRLNAIGIGGKPSVDYIPAHQVIEARENAADFVPLAAPPQPIPSQPPPFLSQLPSTYPPPLLSLPTQLMNPWVQVGSRNFLPNYQLTVHNPPQWQQPSSAFIAPNNVGYAIPCSLPRPNHVAPLLHVVYTPRMRNRTIRGVTKVVRPQTYNAPVRASGPGQGWFQQNNAFSEPNLIRVELPPPVKPEPWRPGVMQKMKDEVPRALIATLPSSSVKEEVSVPALHVNPSRPDRDNIAIGDYTVKKILDVCQQVNKKQKSRLRFEWIKMLEFKKVSINSRRILSLLEKRNPLLKGLTESIVQALGKGTGNEANFYQPSAGIKVETLVPISHQMTFEEVSKKVTQISNSCPILKKLTPLQTLNLTVAIQRKASGTELLKVDIKILRYVGRTLGSYINNLLNSKSVPLNNVRELITFMEIVNTVGPIPPLLSFESLRDRFVRELNAHEGTAAETASEEFVPGEGLDEHSCDRTALIETDASRDPFGIVDLKTLVAKIDEWVSFTPNVAIEWNRTKNKLMYGNCLRLEDYNVLRIAHSTDRRLLHILPLMINKAYMQDISTKPSNYGVNASSNDWNCQMGTLVRICPWLNTIGHCNLKAMKKGLMFKYTLNKRLGKPRLRLLKNAFEMITRTVKSILSTNQQQSIEVDTLIAWVNHLNVSGKKLEVSELITELRNEGGIRLAEGSSQSNVSGGIEIPKNFGDPSEEESGGSDESVEETNSNAPCESSLKVDSGKEVCVRSPSNNTLPGRTKELYDQVANIMSWLTLSEEQNETWKRTKARMENGAAFVAEDFELFRFAASKDERFREIEHLIGIGRSSEEDAVQEGALEEMAVGEESRENTCQSGSSEEDVVEPLLKPSDCTDYASVIAKLGIITSATAELTSDGASFKISYDLYLPATANSAPFRKSNPGKPDYRIVILSPEDRVPGANEVSSLDKRFPDRVPVLFAIVRAGTVSFLRLGSVQLPTDLTEYGHKVAS